MISAERLRAMRERQVELLAAPATIADFVPAPDGRGGESDAWVPRAGRVTVRVAPPTGSLARVLAARYGSDATHVVTLAWGTTVGLRARVETTSGTFELVGPVSGGDLATAVRWAAKVAA